MGKKYLDTKQNSIEASVLNVWAKSSEEQEAIRNAAKLFAQEKMDTKSEGWLADRVKAERDKPGDKASGKGTDSKKPKQPDKTKSPSIIDAIKNAYSRLFNGDFIGMTAYLNTLNEDQSPDQIEIIIGDVNETTLTLINPEDFDQTMSINLENLQIDVNEDGELEFSEGWPERIGRQVKRTLGGKSGVSDAAKNPHKKNIPALKQYNLEVDLAKKQGRPYKPRDPGSPKVPKEYRLPE